MNDLDINEKIMTGVDIKKMFDKHKIDNHKVNYKDFIFDIRSFKFQPSKIYVSHFSYQYSYFIVT